MQRKRSEMTERTFAHVCETGGARRTRLRGRANVQKRYLLQAAAANLGVMMRALFGLGTPRGWADRARKALAAVLADILAFLERWIAHDRPSSPRPSHGGYQAADWLMQDHYGYRPLPVGA